MPGNQSQPPGIPECRVPFDPPHGKLEKPLFVSPHLMALGKSELYSSLWQSCDQLRGGMDASHSKDYLLVLLFVKEISNKQASIGGRELEHADVGQVPVFAVVVEAVADDEFILDFKAHVVGLDLRGADFVLG